VKALGAALAVVVLISIGGLVGAALAAAILAGYVVWKVDALDARRWTPARIFGLALLGLVTLKVFIVDLAALDVAYRVLSFVALGILLLGAAYLYSRLQPASATASR